MRGVAIIVEGAMVGDAMLGVQPAGGEGFELVIGYALHPVVWGRGLASEVAQELVRIGHELGLPVIADAREANLASRRVLAKAGMNEVAQGSDARGPYRVFVAELP